MTASEKAAALESVRQMRADGLTMEAACRRARISVANYYRWTARAASGEAGLVDSKSTGRPPAIVLSEDEEAALRWQRLKKGSLPLAIRAFAASPECSPEVAGYLLGILDREAASRRRASWPLCVRRAAAVTPEEEAQFRGRKATQDSDLVVRRTMEWIDEDGTRHQLAPNDLWESDDMSSNTYFRYVDPATGEETLGRQVLLTLDVFSNHYLGISPVGRPSEAYRVEDIAEHMLALVDAWGLPKFWRLERGVWENHFIDGLPVDELGSEFKGRVWGGVNEVIRILRTWTSRGKGTIESSFDHLQAIMAHEVPGADVGRTRGEFEEATRQMLRAKRGNEAALARFPTLPDLARIMTESAHLYNNQAKTRQAFGARQVVPAELFAERPPRRVLPATERWRFLPVKKLATVRQGAVTVAVEHWGTQSYQVAGVIPKYLGHGHRVLVAFHPGKPEDGAHIFNADMTARNREGYRFAELLGIAPRVGNAPQIDLRSAIAGRAGGKKKQRAAMRSEFAQMRAIGEAESGLLRISTAVDGEGRAVRTRTRPEPEAEPAAGPNDFRAPLGAHGRRGEPAAAEGFSAHETKRGGEPGAPGRPSDREAMRAKLAALSEADWDNF